MPIADDKDPVRAIGFITVYSAYAEQRLDEILDMLKEESLKKAQASKKILHLLKVKDSLNWSYDEGERFTELLEQAKIIFDKRGEYIHNRYIGSSDGSITMNPGRPNRPQELVTSGTLYDFANLVFDLQSSFNASKFWVSRAINNIEQDKQADA